MIPNASDIEYFVEISQTENLSRAAERLGVSQPSLSLAMQRLEHSVGAKLFFRSKKGVSLTPAGKNLYAHARGLLQMWQDIQQKSVSSHEEVRGQFTIGCHASVALYSLPTFLKDLMSENPGLEIKLEHDLSRKITESVISMRADIGIVVNPVSHPDLVIHKICKDQVTLWNSGKNTTPDVLICDPELLQTQDILKKLKKAGLQFSRVIQSPNLEVVRELTLAGVGTGILPSRVALRGGEKGLHLVRNAPVYMDEIAVIFRMESKNVKAVQAISEAIRQKMKEF